MKKLLLTGLLAYGFFVHADMHLEDNYINVQAGLQAVNDPFKPENSRFVLSYGISFESEMGNYLGFAEIGIKAPTVLLSLKYGYELMRDNDLSFGTDIAFMFGIPAISFLGNYPTTDLGLGVEPGVFVKIKAGYNMAFFVRGGILFETPFQDLKDLFIAPIVDLGLQYKL